MKATTYLRDHHRDIEHLLGQLRHAVDPDERRTHLQDLAMELGAHFVAEHEAFYPGSAEATGQYELIRQLYEEHAVVSYQLRRLLGMRYDDPGFVARVETLANVFEQHVRNEEAHLFRALETGVRADFLEDLGYETERRFERALQQDYDAGFAEDAADTSTIDRVLPSIRAARRVGRVLGSGAPPAASIVGQATRRAAAKSARLATPARGKRRVR